MPIRSNTKKNKVYKFVHHQDVWIQTNIIGKSFQNHWLEIEPDGKITVLASKGNGYAWDGCSPKGLFLDVIWGTPDGKLIYRTEKPITYFASMIHDVLYQYKEKIPLSRKDTDVIFKINLQKDRFKLSVLYYMAVRLFGGWYGKWKTEKSQEDIKILDCTW